jgi:DNA-binding HxlR family transcriptional regulator
VATRKADLYNGTCPSRDVLGLIGSKWSMLILCVLREGTHRTGVLRRKVGGISQKMMTQTLRDLERNGIVRRIRYDKVPPHVEYELTALGESLSDLVQSIESWITGHYPRILSVQRQFDARQRRFGAADAERAGEVE